MAREKVTVSMSKSKRPMATDPSAIPRKGRKLSSKIQRRRRKPGEVLTPRATIRCTCLECCGWDAAEVARCTAPSCWAWPWRLARTGGPWLDGEDIERMRKGWYDPAQEASGKATEAPF